MIDEKAKVNLRSLTRKKMEKEGWSQVELAKMLSLSPQNLNDWLQRRSGLAYDRVELLLSILDIIPRDDF